MNTDPKAWIHVPKNPPAFPRPDFHLDTHYTSPAQDGMTLRDYFAAHAVASMLSSERILEIAFKTDIQKPEIKPEQWLSKFAFEIADAMLTDRTS